jgi:ligand-binding sensor domain-containing protein
MAGYLRICFVALWLFAIPSACLAVDPGRPLDQLRITHWDQQNGLLEDGIRSVAQTPEGFLWLTVGDEGLMGFDGAEFVVPDEFKQTSSYKRWAQCLWADPNGRLWIGGSGRVYCRTRNGTFEHYDEKSGLPDRTIITAIATDSEGTLWVASIFHGLFYKSGDRFIEYTAVPELHHQEVYQMCPAKSGDLWVSASEGFYRINKSGGQLLDARNGLPAKLVTALTIDPTGRLWVGTSEGLAYLNQDRAS